MYCSSCGVAVAQGLSYCKHCGAKLNREDIDVRTSGVRPDLLVTSMVATFIFGLLGILLLMGVMKAVLGLPVDRILHLMLIPFGLMLILEGVFIRLLLRRQPQATETSRATLSKEQATNELDAADRKVLPEALPSVTEHTTRAFEPTYIERK
jgi:hypothetical protein